MNLSTGLPRRHGLAGLTRVIGARTTAVSVTRPTTSTGDLDQTQESLSGHTESMWLFEPFESIAQEITGERLSGALGGLLVADGTVDLQTNDRIAHGGVEYEIDTIVGHPDDDDTDGTDSPDTNFWLVNFTRRTE